MIKQGGSSRTASLFVYSFQEYLQNVKKALQLEWIFCTNVHTGGAADGYDNHDTPYGESF